MHAIKLQKGTYSSLSLFSAFGILTFLLIFMSCDNSNKENKDETDVAIFTDTAENTITINDYVTFIQGDTSKMGLDHSYTHQAIMKLTAAVSAKADEARVDIKADLDKLRENAEQIKNNPHETSHANEIRKAADKLSTVLQQIQQAKYPNLANEAGEVNSAASAINPDILTLDQRDAIKSFFAKSANLLQRMN